MTESTAAPLFSTPCYAREASVSPVSMRFVVAQDAASATMLLDHPVSTVLLSLSGELLAGVEHEQLAHSEALCLRLQVLLSQAPAGTRLYAVGDESFLWQAQRTARQAGLLVDEIELFKQGTRRRMYCVHCSGFQDIADEGECTCSHCGVRLLVREHFSQRLGAYMGVCLNPDQPYAEARP